MDGNGKLQVEELLVQLIDAVKNVGLENAKTNVRLEKLNADVNERFESLEGKIEGVRDELVALKTATAANLELLARMDRRGADDVVDLRSRVTRIEEHIGLRSP